jgi:cytochrome P450
VWNLACHPEIEAAVIQEVAALPDGFTDDNLRKCKLLNNVLTEMLRIRPPIGQSLPCVVPEGGAELCGHHIPGGANVVVQAWSMHRNPTVLKDPERFIPARWDNPSTDMLQSFYMFGGGSRGKVWPFISLLGTYLTNMDLSLHRGTFCSA